ncbi:MAG: SIR2 family protein [Anaerolineaceae bacterium]|nr:SIR2 family protein [Anaerolineaceae bacterium]
MTQTQKRGAAVANLLTSRSRGTERSADSEWTELNRRINLGQVIPVISNALRYDGIFYQLIEQARAAANEADPNGCASPVVNMAANILSQVWAGKIQYPLADTNELPRVAQFNRSRSRDDEQAKVDYLEFLKESLLAYAENLGVDKGVMDELYSRVQESSFSDLVQELEYPHFAEGKEDPLRILARLPLPIYVTTCFHDFIERALVAENKHPVTQVCFWSGQPLNISPEHKENKDFVPSADTPLVYHLYGFERYPTSLVLSEDDYLDFLVKVIQDTDVERPVIPVNLKSALSVSSLIMLGYQLQDWDFRVLFRGIVNARQNSSRGFSFIIQLNPDQQYEVENVADVRKYLETYFQPRQFNVAWGDVDQFLSRI